MVATRQRFGEGLQAVVKLLDILSARIHRIQSEASGGRATLRVVFNTSTQECEKRPDLALADTRRQSVVGDITAELDRTLRPLRPAEESGGVLERNPVLFEKGAQAWHEILPADVR
ncbi:hypothetical protein KPG71_05995 [Roseovarius sp. PS-C2]|uniref:hypothetical protein n=1 Tax=Roseovarius sp. PS-C2 TaxID=2820814 RepID=UPI001C0E29C3|nr:hypothetical protein [Roseovarius sp. PS-C2]MBU3259563.1 hypothetical protein [Roseovarius sp. PS-C2]